MAGTAAFRERVGAVFIPEVDGVIGVDDGPGGVPGGMPGGRPNPEEPIEIPPFREFPTPLEKPTLTFIDPTVRFRHCFTVLKQGCYSVRFTPNGLSVLGTRFRGTLRVEQRNPGYRISGDLYRYRLLDDIVVRPPEWWKLDPGRFTRIGTGDDVDDQIPVYSRRSYHSYLKGTGATLYSFRAVGQRCSFSLTFDEFVYTHPSTGFSGTFPTTPNRTLRFHLSHTDTADSYTGTVFEGSTAIGTVTLRWISPSYRRSTLVMHTLNGAVAPPADVGGSTFASIFADVGWQLSFTDSGTVNLPAALAGININACWSRANLHTLMSSVPGYNPADLDTVWRTHLVVVPAALNCSRGVMFDSSLGADPNTVPREGTATFSHDGYPAADSSNFDAAVGQQQRNVPRAYLRSATHEVGHAYNQIHQNFEGGIDNSIMTPTPSVADVLGAAGVFPDDINLAFNETVKRHLRHLPDPAVRPGGMDFFGSAIAAPEASDVDWLDDMLEVRVEVSDSRPRLGQPIDLRWTLVNTGGAPVPAPARVDAQDLVARVSVADPSGVVTFMRPAEPGTCVYVPVVELPPGGQVASSTTLFWGKEGFAFQAPGHHKIEVIVLWELAGVPVATTGEVHVWVAHPVSDDDNEVAALLLHPEVGRAVAAGDLSAFDIARERVGRALALDSSHPAADAIQTLGLSAPRKKAGAKKAPTKKKAVVAKAPAKKKGRMR